MDYKQPGRKLEVRFKFCTWGCFPQVCFSPVPLQIYFSIRFSFSAEQNKQKNIKAVHYDQEMESDRRPQVMSNVLRKGIVLPLVGQDAGVDPLGLCGDPAK